MTGFNLALALTGAFVAGVTVTLYVWWFVAPLVHDNGNIFDPFAVGDDSLKDMPTGAVTGRDSGKVTPGNWATRDIRERQEHVANVRHQARHDAERKPRNH